MSVSVLATHSAFILIGLGCLYFGSELLVRHSVRISNMLGISSFLTGFTVVALGTSMPEVFTAGISSLRQESVLTFTGLVGSNIFNVAAILGLTCLVRPYILKDSKSFGAVDLATFLLASVLPFVFFIVISPQRIARFEALLMLSSFSAFFIVKIHHGRRAAQSTEKQGPRNFSHRSFLHSIFLILVAIALLGGGGELLIRAVTRIADTTQGVTRHFLGVLVIACGTSLPELFASLVAVFRKEQDISLGNLLGSTIFNTLLILPLANFISAIHIDRNLLFDLSLMLGVSIYVAGRLFLGTRISKRDAVLLVGSFSVYVGYLFAYTRV